jgi:hypothetical protein
VTRDWIGPPEAAESRGSIADSYRRFLFDMHIPDWDPAFFSRFDPQALASAVKRVGAATVTLFSNSHTGLNNWPSAVGRMHGAHDGRDVLGDMIQAAHAADVNVNLYYCLLYVDWYWDNFPEARIVDARGESRKVAIHSTGRPRRFSALCPNAPGYRKFVAVQIAELAERYHFEGVNLDMTFWPAVCYCANCRARFASEVGGDIPDVVDWTSPKWLAFARRRQAWLTQFVREATLAFQRRRPETVVAHQSNGYVNDWQFGVSDELARLSSWLTADLYRDRRDLAFSFKLFYAASERRPFEIISGWVWPNIFEHSVLRTLPEIEETAVLPIANDAAIMFIDQVDPVGTIAEANFDLAAPVLAYVQSLEPFLGGDMVQDVGVYVSFDASFDLRQNGQRVADLGYTTEPANIKGGPSAHRSAALSAGETLARRHIPFGVVTRKSLSELARWRVIVLANVALLDNDEVAAFRAYVEQGGGLYASGATSLLSPNGECDRLRLGETLGAEWLGETAEALTYMAPTGDQRLGRFTRERPLTIHERQSRVRVVGDRASVRATVTLPYTEPTGTLYASLLTDPPGRPTEFPAIVENRGGKGRTVYVAAPLEAEPHESQREVFAELLASLTDVPWSLETNAPSCVEVTMFRQPERNRLVIHLVNVQADTPPVPVGAMRLSVRSDGRDVEGIYLEPGGAPVAWRPESGGFSIFHADDARSHVAARRTSMARSQLGLKM